MVLSHLLADLVSKDSSHIQGIHTTEMKNYGTKTLFNQDWKEEISPWQWLRLSHYLELFPRNSNNWKLKTIRILSSSKQLLEGTQEQQLTKRVKELLLATSLCQWEGRLKVVMIGVTTMLMWDIIWIAHKGKTELHFTTWTVRFSVFTQELNMSWITPTVWTKFYMSAVLLPSQSSLGSRNIDKMVLPSEISYHITSYYTLSMQRHP